ncbi:KRI1 family protein [Aspergillus chevalieri]|uniref:KRRI-interacting protein 1 n=1 Tax=Aspergillus chevalieri TaxID=182096 RepID=A0A7R7VI11_ASPCH|nr:KRRI-interacting protein 1 [Aspergillus chevalieri]BCR84114.1 KRRI-interacting protein 1 [Aspergillus chevalieri]
MEPPSKKARKLLDDDSDSGNESGGVPIGKQSDADSFKINEDYARRFEHNKKREEMQKLESKFGKTSSLGKRRDRDEDDGSSEESSDDEDEDDDAELATEALDAEINATLNAIRSKDPRVYDSNVTFYSQHDDTQPDTSKKQEKPMTLRDYHRENYLSGATLTEDNDAPQPPKTYAQEQEELKDAVIKEMHAAADDKDASADEEDGDEDNFLIRKSAPEPAPKPEVKLDVENADKDPENFLSNFMSSRAWIPTNRELHPFESEDEDEDERAEAFEEAYNFRFEDPNKANERITTHARDATNQQSVRREEKSSRKKHREAERLRKEEEKKERETEKNRLRKLKVDQLQEKVNQIKEVAGFRASKFTDEDWAKFLDDAWDDKNWEQEMQRRFGEDYYAEEEGAGSDDESGGKKKKPKKPTWDDDIDITDIVPDFDAENPKPSMEESDAEMDDAADGEGSSSKKSKAQEKRDQKRDARKERMRIEEAADRNLDLDINLLPGATKKNATRFRYRETSPQSFGLSARDILMADDSHLNKFAGLKKLASFREEEKKQKDRKKLGKKARVRQWRKDTFGNEEGPEFTFGGEKDAAKEGQKGGDVDIREGGRKKKRRRTKKN